ncbi:Dyp-type peroxidase, partial [Achromobacter ruhlandii]|uniref:Dyp-type peroxidase n=1 Tax=Achromobacter ruhlandii TaxID=72557 RepID=UPI000ADAF531
TENPQGFELPAYTLIGDEDEAFAGGSYVLVQKYLHDMAAWEKLSTEQQELILGRRKLTNVELPDDVKPSYSHSALTTQEEDGQEIKILRDNMPFGRAGAGEFGTYFIGYSRHLWVTQKMPARMFLGDPPGMHDRLLDFSTAHTGAVFFAPAPRTLSELVEAVQA